jgi:16S rRNA (cytosine1402-N4)-methyltransferase
VRVTITNNNNFINKKDGQNMNDYHKSVLLNETIEALNIKPECRYIDATLGGGGHTREIIERGGVVLGIDVDEEALQYAEKDLRFKIKDLRIGTDLILVKGNFREIDKLAKKYGFEKVEGAVFDLGVSSHQLETPERGFSFQFESELDMRMDRDLSIKAGDLINGLTKKELYELLTKFGEERFAWIISESIVSARQVAPIRTSRELAEIIRKAVRVKKDKINPATRTFQALRIAVNDEITSLKEGLERVLEVINKGGRIAVISFHSLEDRIVKNKFKEWEEMARGHIITKKPIVPSEEEIRQNNRARSAKLRVFEKI